MGTATCRSLSEDENDLAADSFLVLLAEKSFPNDAKHRVFFVLHLYSGIGSCRKVKDPLMVLDDIGK